MLVSSEGEEIIVIFAHAVLLLIFLLVLTIPLVVVPIVLTIPLIVKATTIFRSTR